MGKPTYLISNSSKHPHQKKWNKKSLSPHLLVQKNHNVNFKKVLHLLKIVAMKKKKISMQFMEIKLKTVPENSKVEKTACAYLANN